MGQRERIYFAIKIKIQSRAMINSDYLLQKLPPFTNSSLLIENKQSVHDIINEVLEAHKIFENDYNNIAADFWAGSPAETAKVLFKFLKDNVRYKIEGEDYQTTKSPAAILAMKQGDCKHYAGFIGGILAACSRLAGQPINWKYRFAAYNGGTLPEHVFIVLNDQGREIWIDPVLKTFNERLQPTRITDKKIKEDMALMRLSGIEEFTETATPNYPISAMIDATVPGSEMYNALQLLLKHGVMDANAKVNDFNLAEYQTTNPALFNQLLSARQLVQGAALNGFLSDVWRGVKKITLAPARSAYLSLVAINAFGYATKHKTALYNTNGTFTPYKDKLKELWQDKFGGDFSSLINTIEKGATHRAVMGEVITFAAWIAAAGVIIAAITPILKDGLKTSNQAAAEMLYNNIDPATGQPYGTPTTTSGGIMETIKQNPLLIAGGLAAIYFFTKKKTA